MAKMKIEINNIQDGFKYRIDIIFFMFCAIFAFLPIQKIPFLTSSIFLGLFFFLRFCLNKIYRKYVFNVLFNKKNIYIILSLIFIIIYSLFLPTFKSTFDYSIIQTFLNQLLNLSICVFLLGYIFEKGEEKRIIDYIVIVFWFQSIIQISSFLIPQLREFFDNFKNPSNLVIVADKYNGYRGLAVSNSNFFGLATSYGLIYLLFAFYHRQLLIKKSTKVLIAFCLGFGGISAGRSSVIGLVFAIAYLLLRKLKYVKKSFVIRLRFKVTIRRFLAIFVIIIILIFSPLFVGNFKISEEMNNKLDAFNKFAFELIINYREGNGFSSGSTDTLRNMYFPVSGHTLLLGDGKYTSENGLYYMNTDAGYMRNILFFGLIGFFIIMIYQIQFFDWKNHFFKSLFLLLFLMSMHIKGEVVGFLIITQIILFMVLEGGQKHE